MRRRIFTTPEVIADAIARSQKGESLTSIADFYGVRVQAVSKLMKRQGIAVRAKPFGLTESDLVVIARRTLAGEWPSTIAAAIGHSKSAVLRVVIKQGLPRLRPGGQIRVCTDAQKSALATRWQSGATLHELQKEFHVSYATVRGWLDDMGITYETRYPSGARHTCWKGGLVVRKDGGYRLVHVAADHPFASMRIGAGYVMEHRLVMAQAIGRPLTESETVHHINGDKQDNRLENLQLRIGNHGKGVVYHCADCGSYNLLAVRLSG